MKIIEVLMSFISSMLRNLSTSKTIPMKDPAVKFFAEGSLPWYKASYSMMTLDPKFETSIANAGRRVLAGKDIYSSIEKATKVPWYVIGGIHLMESGCNFKACLHNGEQIIGTGRKTTLVPAGRGPFNTWFDAAVDAIKMNTTRWQSIASGKNDIAEILYAVERYNGVGYISGAGAAVVSPYLWARTSMSSKFGKYVSDGKFDPKADANAQVGFCAVLKWLEGHGEIEIANEVDVTPIVPVEKNDLDTLLRLAEVHGMSDVPIKKMIKIRDEKYPNSHPRYWGVFDLGQHSRNKRFYLFDVVNKTVKNFYCTHGSGSDRNNDGIADTFSNLNGSHCTSLGVYRVAETYYGAHGLSARLDGLEASNSLARSRAVVIHGAMYATEVFVKLNGRAGRSNGCLAFGDEKSAEIVNALKGGSFVIAWKA